MRRAVNLVYLHLLDRLSHPEGCTQDRCVRACEVADFLNQLQQPLLTDDSRRLAQENERLAALVYIDREQRERNRLAAQEAGAF
jgi:hypothetical protein